MNANECAGCEWEPETQFRFEKTAHSVGVRYAHPQPTVKSMLI